MGKGPFYKRKSDFEAGRGGDPEKDEKFYGESERLRAFFFGKLNTSNPKFKVSAKKKISCFKSKQFNQKKITSLTVPPPQGLNFHSNKKKFLIQNSQIPQKKNPFFLFLLFRN